MQQHPTRRWAVRSGVTALLALMVVPLTAGTSQADPAGVASGSPAGAVAVYGPTAGYDAVPPPPPGLVATAVTALDSFNNAAYLAIRPDRTVVGWGSFPAYAIPPGLTDVTSVDIGAGVGVALRADGSVVTWTYADDPSLAVPADLGKVTAISAGGRRGVSGSSCGFVVALRRNGTVRAWGEKPYGSGCGDFVSQARPPAGLSGVVGIAAGAQHALALCSDGTVVGWGDNSAGATSPPPGLDHVVQVAAGNGVSFALREDGTVVQWGSAYGGPVPDGLRDVVSIQAAEGLAVALRSDGSTVAWGYRAGDVPSLPVGPGISAVAAGYGQLATITVPTAVGSPRVGPRLDTNPAGRAEAFRYVATSSATPGSLNVYLDRRSTATQVQVGLYADAGGRPGRLLTSGAVGAPVADGWNRVAVPGVRVNAGTTYWLALLTPKGSGTVRFRDQADGQGGWSQTSAQTGLTSLPATWQAGGSFDNSPASLYAG